MQGKSAREKGARREREFAALLREHGFVAERTGRNGRSAEDVSHSIRGVHFEVKGRNRFEPVGWLRQARDDCPVGTLPVAVWKRNNGEWIALLGADEFLELLSDFQHLQQAVSVLRETLKREGGPLAPLSPPLGENSSRKESDV